MSMIRQMEGLKILIIYSFLFCNIRTASTRDAISLGQSIREGETVVSASESFELGFFSPGKSKSRYLGIWFKKIATGTVTWVANRDAPLSDRSGVLSMSRRGNGTALVLLNSTNDIVWSSNIVSRAAQNPVAVLLESGNLVVKEKDGNDNDDPDHFLWQSFDYPSHTLLAGMKLGVNLVTGLNRLMSSWKSADDPARSEYTYGIDPSGVPQAMLKKGSTIRYRAGSWNGLHWTGMPQLQPNPVYTFEFVSNENEVFYRFKLINSSVPTMMVINTIGDVQRFTWMEHTKKWGLFARFSGTILDQCDNYALCGPYASCNIHSDSPDCECLEGFEPKSPGDWYMLDKSGGCGRKTPLNCKHGDGFLKLKTVKVPDTRYAQVDKNISLLECKELCSRNCSCTAYANSDVRGGGSGCLLWFHDLIDIKVLPEIGQDIYVRMAASELGMLSFLPVPSAPGKIERRKQQRKAKQVTIIITSILLATGVILLGAIVYIWKKKHRNYGKTDDRQELYSNEKGSSKEEMELPIFDWKTIVDATDNFSEENKLGEGGFGPVYKGMLIEGQEIAVKRLSKSSGQGVEEFKNEALLIAKLQHRNLVKLLGCCTQRDERVLVYEYLPNKSLDYFIFGSISIYPNLKILSSYKLIVFIFAWQLWIQDRPAELIDKSLYDSCSLSEAIRCIQVGLLCVQQIPEDRPNMLSVVLMLSGERSLPQPKQPGFFTERNLPESESSSSKQNLSSTNEISFSMLEAR
ncbi:hypothetical protein CUMW_146030 [Citrus unshiu]|nr:hypothetical protein CUMW_146030 [Citrus unshiu]